MSPDAAKRGFAVQFAAARDIWVRVVDDSNLAIGIGRALRVTGTRRRWARSRKGEKQTGPSSAATSRGLLLLDGINPSACGPPRVTLSSMAADPARRRASYEDVLRAPDCVVAEVLDGELYTNPRPAGPHAEAASVLGMDLGGAFHRGRGGPGGWIILDEPELHLQRDILVPDLAGWLRSRLPSVPRAAFIELAPDWVCDVVSPGSERVDRGRKLPIYAREHVLHVWLAFDPVRYCSLRLDTRGGR